HRRQVAVEDVEVDEWSGRFEFEGRHGGRAAGRQGGRAAGRQGGRAASCGEQGSVAIYPRPQPAAPMRPLFGFLLLFITTSSLGAQPAPDRFAAVRASIQAAITDSGIPSIAVAVAKGGRVLWQEGFGWADREGRVPATEHTMYSLASISKPITATGLMLLVERGRVQLDRPANDYLGRGRITGLAGDASGATVRRIANHTSGLPLHYMFYYDGAADVVPSMDEAISRYGITVYPPGSTYEYSNLGFGVLDHIIERTSGMTYADFMRSEVFLPLGMTRSSIHVGPGLEPFAAVRYDPQGRRVPMYDFDHRGASAVYTSAHDLLRFGMFHLKNRLPGMKRILADSTLDAMHTSVHGIPNLEYGIGWRIQNDENGLRRVSHSGGMPGVATLLGLYPAEDLAVVVLANTTSNATVGRIASEIVAALVPRYADTLRVRRARATPPRPPAWNTPAALSGQWTGTVRTWQGTQPFTLTFQPDGDVVTSLGNQPRALLWDTAWLGDSVFVGRFAGSMPTDDARLHRHTIWLKLTLRGGTLSGMATAQTVPPDTVFYARSAYAELRR
ncbi:MAG TPA: serine hydrolase domain-containing protein, partial [Gemmatimonadales bacterium]